MSNRSFADASKLRELDQGLRRLARRHAPGPDEEDLVQEVWLELMLRPPRHSRRIMGWMHSALIHMAGRRRTRDQNRCARESEASHSDRSPSVADVIILDERRRDLRKWIARLDPKYEECLRLRFLEGESIETIARQLNAPESTIRTRIKRGVDALRSGGDRKARERYLQSGFPLLGLFRRRKEKSCETAPGRTFVAPSALLGSAGLLIGLLLPASLLLSLAWFDTEELGDSSVLAEESLTVRPVWSNRAPDGIEVDGLAGERVSVAQPEVETRPGRLGFIDDLSGAPLSQLPVSLAQGFHSLAAVGNVWMVTDSEGWIELTGLAPGPWWVRPIRGPERQIWIEAGKPIFEIFSLPTGHDLELRVIDPDQRPLAGAEVWNYLEGSRSVGYRVGVTDAQGRLSAYGLAGDGTLRVFSAGWTPTVLMRVKDLAEREPIQIFVRDRAALITGRVMDSSGAGVDGAQVCCLVSLTRKAPATQIGRGRVLRGDLIQVRTDSEGNFELNRPTGKALTLVAFAPAVGAISQHLGPRVEGGVEVELRLEPWARVAGRVTHADGQPASGVPVTLQTGLGMPPATELTDASGAFTFEEVACGSGTVFAMTRELSATVGFDLLPGELQEDLELLLSDRGVLKGNLSREGTPLAGWRVRLRFPEHSEVPTGGGPWLAENRSTWTSSSGDFRFPACPDLGGLLEFTTPAGLCWEYPEPILDRSNPVRVEIPRALAVRGTLRGNLSGNEPYRAHPIRVQARHALLREPVEVSVKPNGSFSFAELPAGELRLEVVAGLMGAYDLGTFALRSAETLEVGSLAVPPPSELSLHFQGAGPGAARTGALWADTSAGFHVLCFQDPIPSVVWEGENVARLGPFLPGSARLRFRIPGFAQVTRNLDFVSDGSEKLEVPLRESSVVVLSAVPPEGAGGGPWILRVAPGNRASEVTTIELQEPEPGRGRAQPAFLKSTPGWHAVELLQSGDVVATGEFELAAMEQRTLHCICSHDGGWSLELKFE